MSARLAHIFRHPIKAHGHEELDRVTLEAGRTLPWDRRWAVTDDSARLPAAGGWAPCVNFSRGAKSPALMAISAQSDIAAGTVTLRHPERGEITIDPDRRADQWRFLDWVEPLTAPDRPRPTGIVRADPGNDSAAGRGMTDTDFPSISILSLSSLAELSRVAGQELSPLRWRGNLWIAGTPPWAEFDWIGRRLTIGGAELEIRERIGRCRATSANPETGRIDVDTLRLLKDNWGHTQFGVYAVVTRGGPVRRGDPVTLPGPA